MIHYRPPDIQKRMIIYNMEGVTMGALAITPFILVVIWAVIEYGDN